MTAVSAPDPGCAPAPAPAAFTDAILQLIQEATWSDGSPLVDVDPTVLRARLAPQILAATHLLTAITSTGGTHR